MTEPGPSSAARRALLLLTAVLAVALAACVQPVGPARTFDSYEHKAKHTAETALSAVQTGRLGAQSARRDDTFAPYLTMSEGLKLAAQSFLRDPAKLSCCAA